MRRYHRSAAWAPEVRFILFAGLAAGVAVQLPTQYRPSFFASSAGASSAEAPINASFSLCHTGGGTNCVVDGDTFWIEGAKVRIADIDAPETHPPRCAEEADLGERATLRLQELLNAGPVILAAADRDTDRYGRLLRIVERDGRSLGDQLVDEGLARRWTGRRLPWCGASD